MKTIFRLSTAILILWTITEFRCLCQTVPPAPVETLPSHEPFPINPSEQNGLAPEAPPAPDAQADPTPESEEFCDNKDSSAEVKAFCPFLALLEKSVQSHPPRAALRSMLNHLNPGNPAAATQVIQAIAVNMTELSVYQTASQARPDQQLGAASSASGTTSLVTKAGSADLIALAVDTGALTQSANGTTATLNTNVDQMFRLLTGNAAGCPLNCPRPATFAEKFELDVMQPINVSASFALAQTSTSTTATSGQASGTTPAGVTMAAIPTGAGKLTAISVKYQVLNKYDPHSSAFQTAWKKQLAVLNVDEVALLDDKTAVQNILYKHDEYKAGVSDESFQDSLIAAAQSDKSGKQLVSAFEQLWKKRTSTIMSDSALPAAVAVVLKDLQNYRVAWYNAVAQAAGTSLSLQYSFNKPLNQPQTHDFTLIYAYSFPGHGSITLNGDLSIYNGPLPVGANYGRVHYGQASGEYDRTLGTAANSLQTQLTLAAYWQYQPNPSILNIPAGTVAPGTDIPLPNGTQEFVGTAGSLWVTQAKLTIKGSGGINIPVGVSWSNKTDLLQGNKVGAQVGISYNFASLAGLL